MSDIDDDICKLCGSKLDDYGCLGFDVHAVALEKFKKDELESLRAKLLAEQDRALKAETDRDTANAEVERWRSQTYWSEYCHAKAERDRLSERVAALVMVARYAKHGASCKSRCNVVRVEYSDPCNAGPCDCGLTDLLSAITSSDKPIGSPS